MFYMGAWFKYMGRIIKQEEEQGIPFAFGAHDDKLLVAIII